MGGKSEGLSRLIEAGERVPPYVVVPPDGHVADHVATLGTGPYAVRSDASEEDAAGSAQAGRYATYLDVSAADLPARVAAVREGYGGSVIVQEMIAAEVSGVAFSVHPAGIVDQVVVTAGSGRGAVVTGDCPTRTWVSSTADRRRYTYGSDREVPDLLTSSQVDEVTAAALRVSEQRGVPVDVEWAYQDGILHLLQARPVTTLGPPDPHSTGAGLGTGSRRVTLDNSNLVESYPGVVSPLTASFVPRAYEGVFRSLALRVSGDPQLVDDFSGVLSHMVARSSGRLYYRMENWYAVLGLMPFSRRYIDVWQTSLGITDRSYEPPRIRLRGLQRLRAAVGLIREVKRTPAQLDDLSSRVAAVRGWFAAELADASTAAELRSLLERVESELLNGWDVTLLNDLRAFVLPALLRRLVRDDRAVNDLVSGIASIESLQPVRALAGLAADAPRDLGSVTTREAAVRYLAGSHPYARRLRAFVERYGDRYLEELKLESPTFRTDPLLLVETVRTFRRAHESDEVVTLAPPATDAAAPTPSRPETGPALRTRNPVTRSLAGAATRAIAGREASRLDRARVYGMVRAIARRAGDLYEAAGVLDHAEDVFWLTYDELFDPPADARSLVAERRRDQDSYVALPAFRRLTFAGEPFDIHAPLARASAPGASASEALVGVGVSAGTATGEVLVVDDPRTVGDPAGRVLVTATTDPGWVFLLSRATAIVAERGSLLSHTAIVARELGVPAVVGITDATRRLTTGEQVTVDGARGEVRR